ISANAQNYRWTKIQGVGAAVDVTVDSHGNPWIARWDGSIGNITVWGETGTFSLVPTPTRIYRLAMTPDNTLWAVGQDGSVNVKNRLGWRSIPTVPMSDVAWGPVNIDYNQNAWLVGQDGTLWKAYERGAGYNVFSVLVPPNGVTSFAVSPAYWMWGVSK